LSVDRGEGTRLNELTPGEIVDPRGEGNKQSHRLQAIVVDRWSEVISSAVCAYVSVSESATARHRGGSLLMSRADWSLDLEISVLRASPTAESGDP
jgi:hypothetical protein